MQQLSGELSKLNYKNRSRLRLGYMGTPDFSVPALASLIEAKHDICIVYTQPPRPGGRGKKLQKTPIHKFAEDQGILVNTPISLKTPEALKIISSLNLDALVVAAYGLILPPAVLKIPKLGCLNIHASLLPRWRGAAPIQRAIMEGDARAARRGREANGCGGGGAPAGVPSLRMIPCPPSPPFSPPRDDVACFFHALLQASLPFL